MHEQIQPKSIENLLALAADMMPFEQNDRLAQLIRTVEGQDDNEMCDGEQDFVAGAAGAAPLKSTVEN
ncbi:MAG: hypothetical protein GX928_05735 [Ruminococcaceae bacterium]|nr:hypothetical protein [Oscillospiraceae bacterium]